LKNTPLSGLWYGFKVFTVGVAYFVFGLGGYLAFSSLVDGDYLLGIIIAFFSLGVFAFASGFSDTLKEEADKKDKDDDDDDEIGPYYQVKFV
jgi:hypothetical protein